jgi:hypothetical protein
MFYRVIIFILLVPIANSYGQDIDSLKINSTKVLVLTDSLKDIGKSKLDFISALNAFEKDRLDSINLQKSLDHYFAKFNALKSKLTSKIDSLTRFSIHDSLGFRDLNLLKSRLDSVHNLRPPRTVQQAQERLETFEKQISAKTDSIESKISQKLSLFSKNGGNLPGSVNLPGADLNTSLSIDPGIAIPSNLAAPDIELPPVVDRLKNLSTPDIDVNAQIPGNVPNLPSVKVNDIKAPEGISNVHDRLASINEAGDQMKGYQEDLKNLQEGDLSKMQELPDAIESKVENLEEIRFLEEASEEFAAIKAKWNDPEVLKEQALNKAKETAVNHFAGHEKELKAAMDKLSKLKAKIPDPEGPINMFAKRQRFMKDKPLGERVVPGLALQFQKQHSYWVDLNPYIGFKISGWWLAGIGWNERLAYNFDEREWDKANRIYGLRGFLQFKLRTNFWLKADVENMNSPVHAMPVMTSEIVGRDWIWSYFAGIRKEFQFSKGFKGNVQTLYNIYNPDKRSPYTNRLNIRIGFEMILKQKQTIENK